MTDKVKLICKTIKERAEYLRSACKHSEANALLDLIPIIDSLQEEPKKCLFAKDNYTSEDRKVLCEDCEEKCEYSKKEEPVSEELEEACEQLAENARKHKAETLSPFFSQTDYKQGVIDGAKWQKQQMMKSAMEGEIIKISPNDHLRVVSDVLPLKDESEWGTRVKLIIIKQEEE